MHLPWRVQAMAWLPHTQALAVQRQLRALLHRFDYAACTLFASPTRPQATGIWFQAAHPQAPAETDWLPTLVQHLGLEPPHALRYHDAPHQQHRRVVLDPATNVLQAFLLAGDARSATWLAPWLQNHTPIEHAGLWLLHASATPPQGTAASERRQPVCNCLQIDQHTIVDTLRTLPGPPQARLQALQAQTRCGTQCGSCLPQLKKLVQSTPPATACTAP